MNRRMTTRYPADREARDGLSEPPARSSPSLESLDGHALSARRPQPVQAITFKTTCAKIAGFGSYLPERVVTNQELIESSNLRIPPSVLQRGLGVNTRRAAQPHETAADLLARAGQVILEQTGCDPRDLDRIICSCDPGDAAVPATAVAVQARLGARCPAFDLTMSCAGWLCGIDLACRCIATGEQRILVLASSVPSKLHFRDLKHRAIFGDGAGGALVEAADPGDGFIVTELWTDGGFYPAIYIPYPWSTRPAEIPPEYEGSFYMHPNQNIFFHTLERLLPPLIKRLLDTAGFTINDIDWVLLHQPSRPLFDHSLRILDWIPRAKVFGIEFFARYGNLVGAEFPVMLAEGSRWGLIRRGHLIMMLTYGAGFTGAGMIFRY